MRAFNPFYETVPPGGPLSSESRPLWRKGSEEVTGLADRRSTPSCTHVGDWNSRAAAKNGCNMLPCFERRVSGRSRDAGRRIHRTSIGAVAGQSVHRTCIFAW